MRNGDEGQGQRPSGVDNSDHPPEILKDNVRLPKSGDPKENARSHSDWPHIFLYFIPIPIGLALIVILALLDVKSVFDPPGLLLVLNTCFLSLLPFLVAYIAMKGYLSSGSISLIMLSGGCLSLGLGSILAGFVPLTHIGVNGVVAIHNSSALLSSVFQVLGVASALIGLPPQQDPRRKKLTVLSLFLGISVFAGLLTLTNVYGVGPVFFVQGSGPTPLRQIVLGAAFAMFLVSGLLLGAMYLRSGSRFLFFYCMALFLIAEGLFCISIQKVVGGPIGWLGRGLQYLAGIYLLVAILEARSELVVRGLRLDVGIAKLLRHHLEPLVEQRTEELARANDELRQENTERVRAEEALKKAKDELEVRVQERTWELVTTVEALQKEVVTRKEAEEGLRRTARALKALSDCNQALIRAAGESSLLDEICRVIVEVGGYPTAWVVFAQDYESKTMRTVASWGFEERDAEKLNVRWADDEKGRGPTGTAIRTGKISILRNAVSDPVTGPWRDELEKYGIGSLISLPVVVKGRGIGAINITAGKPDAFDEDEVKLLEELAGDLAYGIETLRTRVAHRHAEESAERANREWERTFNAISDLIMVLDNQHKILRSNKAMADALGMTEQELMGKSCFELVHGEKEPPGFCPHTQLVADGEEHSAEVVEPRLGGIFDVRVSPLVGQDGQVIGSVHITHDITARKKTEEALSQSESMLRGVLQAAPIGIGVVSDRIFKWTNEFVFKMTGYAQEELMGQSARILYENDEEFERVGAVKYSQIRETGTGTTETRWKRKDGTIIDIILSSTVIDPENPSAGVVFTALDVTERKQAQQALGESEERYRAVFDNAGIGIDLVDRNGRIVQANPALLNMLGYAEEELHRLTLMDIVHPDDRSTSRRHFEGLLAGEIDSCTFEKRYLKKDGSMVWGDLSVSTIRDPEGNLGAMVGVIADITERKKSQINLKQSEERLRLIIDSAPIGIMIVQEGKYVYANPRFVEIFGYEKADEILGLPVEAIYVPDSKELIVQRSPDSASGTRTISHYEAVGVSKTGKRIDAGAWVTEIEYLGGEASLAFVMDMTESNSLRSQFLQAQKMEAIGTLAGGIAHDFNNLLTVILGYSELLVSEKGKKDRDYEDLKKIMYAGRTAADMVQQILAFSRKAETKARPINLNKQVKQLQKMLSRLIPRTIEVRINLDPDPPPVNADPSQMDQVLMNLAVNARDAMPEGGRLTIETKTIVLDDDYCRSHIEAAEGLHVLLMVTDTGVGIDKTSVGRIFEPYYTTKKPGEGTGLGLATVYGIVKGHGGHITCYSEPGVGTTFKIYLPVHQIGAEHDVAESHEFPAFGTGTILLVDDEEFLRSLGQRILEKSGYRVVTASNGAEAVAIYKQRKDEISLIILDLIMPVMDGRQCLGEILRIDPGARVLIASGYSPDGTTRETLAGGAKGFVGKPYNLKELLKAVREALDL